MSAAYCRSTTNATAAPIERGPSEGPQAKAYGDGKRGHAPLTDSSLIEMNPVRKRLPAQQGVRARGT